MTWTDRPTNLQEALDNLTAENWHAERALIERALWLGQGPPEFTVPNDRGFRHYDPISDGRGASVKISESSAAEAPHIWLEVDAAGMGSSYAAAGAGAGAGAGGGAAGGAGGSSGPRPGVAHLSIERAERVIATLRRAISEHYQTR